MAAILIIDDDPEFSEALRGQLKEVGHDPCCLECAEEGLRRLVTEPFDLVLLDNKMPRMSGLDFLAALKQEKIVAPPVILMTASPNDSTAIQATKRDAFDYVIKPLDFGAILGEFEDAIQRALKVGRPMAAVGIPKPDEKEIADDSVMVGRSKALREVFRRIGLLEGDESVLILGETGTGKELVAQAIHTNSARQAHPFIAINCAALAPNLLESELFGHEKGAFTGADKMRKGYFEHACGGTLFLDEVGDMPEALQVKLLRVLQNREITRMGGCEPIEVDVRILAATSRDMKKYVQEGKFRQDLYYRLEGTIISMPALRERKDDIELLAKHFLRRLSGNQAIPPLHTDALQALRNHAWPGNIRQLDNVMRRARKSLKARRGTEITPDDLDFGELDLPTATNETHNLDEARANLRRVIAWAWESDQPDLWPLLRDLLECELLRYAISQPDISEVQLARKLRMARNTLRDRLKQHGLKEPADLDP